MIAFTLLLLAGEAGALTTCDSLANVKKWNGSGTFSYSSSAIYTGDPMPWETIHYEWTQQQSADISFRLHNYGAIYDNTLKYDLVEGSETGEVNLNDINKETFKGETVVTRTKKGSGSPENGIATLYINFTTCEYRFAFNAIVNGVTSYVPPGDSSNGNLNAGFVSSGFYPIPITSTILSGSANFPVYDIYVVPLTYMDTYIPGGWWTEGAAAMFEESDPGSAVVTWKFEPDGLVMPIIDGTIAGNVTNASSGMPIAGARVIIGSVSTTTDINGNYSIKIAPGTYDVTASASGYASQTISVTVPPATKVIRDFALEPKDLLTIYDADDNGKINKNEALQAVGDYFSGKIPKQDAMDVVILYFSG